MERRQSTTTSKADLLVAQMAHSAPGPIRDALQALIGALQDEFAGLARAREYERIARELIAETILLGRKEASAVLACSVAQLDRLTQEGKLEVTLYDSRPRYQLAELRRFITAATKQKTKSERRKRKLMRNEST